MENKKENKKVKITLERMARMMADGFDELSDKVATKEEQNDLKSEVSDLKVEMNTRFTELENKLESYTSFWHRKFNEHEVWLQSLDKSVASLERTVGKK